jgi:YVTN family beta-propeller protein
MADASLAAPKAYVGNFRDNTVSVIDTASNTAIATVAVAAGPHGMSLGRDGRFVYVTGDASTSMSVIDTATDRVVRTVEVGTTPHGVALTPDGKTLLVGVYGEDRVAFVDTATLEVVASVPVPKPHTIAIHPDGRLAYVASQEPGNFALVIIDLGTRATAGAIALDKAPRDPEFDSGGHALYFTRAGVNAVAVLDPATNRIVAEIPTGASPHIASHFRGATFGVAIVQGPGELLLFDPATNTPGKSIAVGKQPHWMASGDGRHVWVTNEGSNTVSVVDTQTGQTTTIAVGNAPRKVVVQPSAAVAANRIGIVDFAFAPAELSVRPGTHVVWANDDGAPHGIRFKDGGPGNDLLLPGAEFARDFDRNGMFDYVCSVHPYMSGRIVVQPR